MKHRKDSQTLMALRFMAYAPTFKKAYRERIGKEKGVCLSQKAYALS